MNTATSNISGRLTAWFLRKTSISAVRRIAAFPAAISSDLGIKRDENQDRVAIVRGRDAAGRPYILAALSDGIGGMRDGSLCAAATLGHLFADFFEVSRSGRPADLCLMHAAQAANSAVFDRYAGKGGATLSALLVSGDGSVRLLNVGDSRIYRVTGDQLIQLTVDDTIAGQLGRKVDADMGENLLQFIGVGKALETKVLPLEGNTTELILLTSDGIHYLDQHWLAGLIQHASDPGLALRRMTETAKWFGGHDNASAAMLVPRLAIQEPFANGETDVCEVWDPFGELQLINAQSRPVQPALTPRVEERPLPSVAHDAQPSNVSAKPSPEVSKPAKSRKRRERKTRTPDPKNTAANVEGGKARGAIPQLKIDFPKKTAE
jgi:PPM family protein phosphatase